MATSTALYATQLRLELAARNRSYARGRAHVESYGSAPVIVYEPDAGRHGNFFDSAYAAILARPEWMRRFDKIHAQAARSLPKPQSDIARRWRELDSSMSSDALLMNVFCSPGVAESLASEVLATARRVHGREHCATFDAAYILAGVYRREGNGDWQRVSPPQPVVGPGFHDVHVEAGHTYQYAVTSIDQGGRESARSKPTEESVPAP